jgi:DNA-binding transcriptional regulator YhcF (GntR family)
MGSGVPLTEEEKDKIRKEIRYKSKRQLAHEMDLNPLTVRRFVQLEKLEE